MGYRPERGAGIGGVDLGDRTILVTGSTDGIGRETALALGRLGATVVVHGRDPQKGAAVVDRLEDTRGDGQFLPADFASLDAVRHLAEAVRDRVDRLDVLVNNAGAYFRRGGLTLDGIERTMAVNHAAPFLLTNQLLPIIPGGGRIVTVSSTAHYQASRTDLTRHAIESVARYSGTLAYARSKLANVLFTRELARRVDPAANTLHPGLIPGSGLWRVAPIWVRLSLGGLAVLPDWLMRRVADTPASGAETPVYLAAGDVDTTGEYFVDCEPQQPSSAARDDELARRLWRWSEELTGIR